MADDVFALSPISARPAQPSEADYEAIRDAFMETSRGRWFLGEYAKRNRNADTSMVLDAVARIEQALAAQQRLQQQQEMQAAQEAEASVLPEVLAAIRHAVASAEGAATAALDGLALEQNLAPVRKGLRIIKEISWRWREIGADSRICDLIDSQVVAIDAACNQLTGADPRAAMIASFDVIRAQLDGFEQAEMTATPAAEDESAAPAAGMTAQPQSTGSETNEATAGAAIDVAAPAAPTMPAEAAAEPVLDAQVPAAESVVAATPVEPAAIPTQSPHAQRTLPESSVRQPEPMPQAVPAQAPVETPAAPAMAPAAAPSQATGERAEVVDEVAAATVADDDLDIVVVSKAEADAHDEAILELVAAEMAAPESAVDDKVFSPTSTIHYDIEEPVSVDDDIVATFAEPTAPVSKPALAATTATAAPPAAGPAAPVAAMALPPGAAPSVAAPQPTPVPPSPAPAPRLTVAPPPQAPVVPPQPVMQIMQEPVRPAPAAHPSEQLRPAATLHPIPKPIPQPSLGSTLLASGMLQRPIAANDPLTPIRRMTQPEKIAFFS
jgi:hypothetical protein